MKRGKHIKKHSSFTRLLSMLLVAVMMVGFSLTGVAAADDRGTSEEALLEIAAAMPSEADQVALETEGETPLTTEAAQEAPLMEALSTATAEETSPEEATTEAVSLEDTAPADVIETSAPVGETEELPSVEVYPEEPSVADIAPDEDTELPTYEKAEETSAAEAIDQTGESPLYARGIIVPVLPAQSFDVTAENGVTVTVYAPEGAFPAGTIMDITPVYSTSTLELIGSTVDARADSVVAMDISFYTDETEETPVDPLIPIYVTIKAAAVAAADDPVVIHMDDGGNTTVVPQQENPAADEVSFVTKDFSIYAIVDTTKRLQYIFHNGNEILATEIVKEGQTLYDPGLVTEYGQTFIGWSYNADETSESNMKSIDGLNTDLGATNWSNVTDMEEIHVYANFHKAYYLRYLSQDDSGHDTVLATEVKRTDASDTDRTVTIMDGSGYVADQTFEGWIDVATGNTYAAGSSYTLNGHLDLYLKVQGRYWLVFDANAGGPGSGVAYTEPQLLTGSAVTQKPADPERIGYDFLGWYTEAEGGTEFTFGQPLTADTKVYAHWEGKETTYYVVYWQQNASDATQYDYVKSVERHAKTGDTVNLLTSDTQTSNIKTDSTPEGALNFFEYNTAKSDTTGKTVNANGTTTLNVYFDRKEITYKFISYGNGTTYGRYGIVNGEFVQLYYYSNRNYSEVGNNDSHNTVYYRTGTGRDARYVEYKGPRYSSVNPASSETSFSGLYGSSFSDWPDAGANSTWTYGGYDFPLPLTVFDPLAAYNGDKPGSFSDTTITFTQTSFNSGYTLTLYIQTEAGEWNYTDKKYVLTTADIQNNGTWYPTETFTGFTVHSYQVRNTVYPNGTWTSVTTSGSIKYENSNVFLRYSRNQHEIHFISEGDNVTSRTEEIKTGVYYDSDISGYGQKADGSWYYEPTNGKDGYFFAGWYEDQACTIPLDLSNAKMPDSNINAYAKWDTYRVRVVLVPTKDNANNDEVTFANNQALAFRVNYSESVSDATINSENAHRNGYRLDGWYIDPEFTTLFPFGPVTKDTNGVDMNYQTTADWTNNTYGDNDGEHENVKGILKLYAKWVLNLNENNFYIEYEVEDGYRTSSTTIPVDPMAYVRDGTNLHTTVAEAPTNYQDGFLFKNWTLVNTDGSLSSVEKLPSDGWDIDTSYIRTRTETDDAGNSQTFYYITFRAVFDVDENNKATMVTFNGNGGVTNDAAAEESVSQAVKVNESFQIKGANSFVRDGYTLVGWAFDQNMTAQAYTTAVKTYGSDYAALAKLGIFVFDEVVAADNLELSKDNNWDPLENTLYAIWRGDPTTVKVTKVVEGNMGDVNREFAFTANYSAYGDDGVTIVSKTASFSLKNGETYELNGVLIGETLTLTETDINGYTVTSSKGVVTISGTQATITYSVEKNGAITVTNNKGVIPDTGIELSVLPFALMLTLCMVGCAGILLRRRSRDGGERE